MINNQKKGKTAMTPISNAFFNPFLLKKKTENIIKIESTLLNKTSGSWFTFITTD